MTVSEIHKAFKVQMDKNAEAVAFGGCPAFLPEEIDLFLNQAYIEVISNKFTGANPSQTPFEGSVKRIADLESLVKTDAGVSVSLDSSSNVLTLEDYYNTDGTYHRMFYVTVVLHGNFQRIMGITQSTSDGVEQVDKVVTNDIPDGATCVLMDHDTARKYLKTYNNDPWIDTPISTLENNRLKIYIDTYKMLGPYTIDITYVKYPQIIDNTQPNTEIDEVPDRVLYEVINRATVIALENIESKRAESKLQINNIQE